MGWLTTRTEALERALELTLLELGELRKERAELLRVLAEARDRGDRIANALIEAKGGTAIPMSSTPSPPTDPFEEDATMAEEIRRLITTQGAEAVFNGDV